MDSRKLMGMVVATAVVGLLSSGYQAAETQTKAAEKTVKCMGVNECKGHGECGAPDGSHDCAGKNECKAKGWIKVKTEKECTDKGGTVLKDEKKDE